MESTALGGEENAALLSAGETDSSFARRLSTFASSPQRRGRSREEPPGEVTLNSAERGFSEGGFLSGPENVGADLSSCAVLSCGTMKKCGLQHFKLIELGMKVKQRGGEEGKMRKIDEGAQKGL